MASLFMQHFIKLTTNQMRVLVRNKHGYPKNNLGIADQVLNMLNQQINLELQASYTYLAMASHCGRHDIAFPGCQKYFLRHVEEEKNHAQMIMNFINERRANVTLSPIPAPDVTSWESVVQVFEHALNLENYANEKLQEVCTASAEHEDHFTNEFIHSNLLPEQTKSLYELSMKITILRRVGPDFGIQLFDQQLLLQ